MKQLLFLLLFPCLAMAQYTGNAGQKITLGEQTSADGLVFRGVASIDTVTATSKITRANKQDTSAFLLLDTVTNLLWHYKTASNGWIQAGGGVSVSSFSAGTTGLTPSTATTGAVTLGGTLAVANGGTNLTSFTNNGVLYASSTSALATSSALTFDGSEFTFTKNSAPFFRSTESGTNITSYFGSYNVGLYLGTTTNHPIQFYQNSGEKMRLNNDGELTIGYGSTDNGAYKLQVKDSVYVGGNVSASAYTTRSDYDLKDEIQNISYGINEVMQMQPVKYTYKSNGSTQLGFIAQDLGVITPEVVSFEDKMSVYYNALIPILTKAIQEQQALIKTLEQRILILENK